MAGETELKTLIASMQPSCNEHNYVFCTLADKSVDYSNFNPLGTFCEKEGMTLILDQNIADANQLEYESIFRCITLTVHSSLDAVGLTAAISAALAEQGISANVVAAYYHDHVFVPADKTKLAMDTLLKLSAQ